MLYLVEVRIPVQSPSGEIRCLPKKTWYPKLLSPVHEVSHEHCGIFNGSYCVQTDLRFRMYCCYFIGRTMGLVQSIGALCLNQSDHLDDQISDLKKKALAYHSLK